MLCRTFWRLSEESYSIASIICFVPSLNFLTLQQLVYKQLSMGLFFFRGRSAFFFGLPLYLGRSRASYIQERVLCGCNNVYNLIGITLLENIIILHTHVHLSLEAELSTFTDVYIQVHRFFHSDSLPFPKFCSFPSCRAILSRSTQEVRSVCRI